MIARKVAPVIATGCTAVIKVPSETPYTNLAIMEVCPIQLQSSDLKLMTARQKSRRPRRSLERHHDRSKPPRYRSRTHHQPLDQKGFFHWKYPNRKDASCQLRWNNEEDD